MFVMMALLIFVWVRTREAQGVNIPWGLYGTGRLAGQQAERERPEQLDSTYG